MKNQEYQRSRIGLILIIVFLIALLGFWGPAQAKALDLLDLATPQAASETKISPEVQETLDTAAEGDMITVIVTMRSQANLSKIGGTSRQARSEQVIRALQNQANATQLHLRALLENKKQSGQVAEYESFWVFNGLAVTATAEVIEELAARPEVSLITPNETDIQPTVQAGSAPPEANISVVNASALWDLGYQGQGIVVANMDSGVDYGHPDLADRWRGGTNSWYDPYGEHPSVPTDIAGHGTWTMGVMVGGDAGGTSIGVAPEAQWVAVKIFDDGGDVTNAAIHSGFQWLLDPDGNPSTADAPDVVNNSWSNGSGGCNLEFELDMQALRAAGILPVFAAGNGGPYANSSRSPANNPSAFAVGATTDLDAIYFQSSRGPSACSESQTIFPDLVAPGVDIQTSDLNGFYISVTGTSLAAPHVSGALALLLSASPNLNATDQQQALLNGATDLGAVGPDNEFGYGRLDILAAYQWLQENGTPEPVENLALNKPVSVSSSEDIEHDGSRAFDGLLATSWHTQKAKGKNRLPTEWISVDLGSSQTVGRVELAWDANYATSFSIQVSENNATWSTIYSTTSGNGGNDSITFSPIQARYVQMVSSSWSNGGLRNWLNEFEIYAGAGEPPPATDTPTPTNTPTATATPAPPPTATPLPGGGETSHIGDLEGSSASGSRNRWDASVVISVHDQDEFPVADAFVSGSWSSGSPGNGSCTTGSTGSCTIVTSGIKGNVSAVNFKVGSVQSGTFTYQPDNNHDPDGDSTGTIITIAQP